MSLSHDHAEFEAVIGLEVHTQLATESKIFCRCRARLTPGVSVADIAPNSNTCPVCAGHPGALPVLNRKVVEYAIQAGLATNCQIRETSVFARKNYFYPDLPKGYQISQFDLPICELGHLDIDVKGQGTKRVQIVRIHIEEDAGKNVHSDSHSSVNLNRAGVPLIEIVSAPDLRSPEEAGAYLRALYAVVTYLGICDGNLQEGNFRCDANVSVRPKGQKEFGTRTEIKNVNSFRYVEKAIEYEIRRQIELVQGGGKVIQETRGYDPDKNQTFSQRSKEEAHDYRYFPEPDLFPLVVEAGWVEKLRAGLPELPTQMRDRFIRELGLSDYDAGVVTGSKAFAEFFDEAVKLLEREKTEAKVAAKAVANIMTGELSRLLNDAGVEITEIKVKPRHVADLILNVTAGTISGTAAKTVLSHVWKSGEAVASVVEREGLKQVSDVSALEPVIDQILAANPKAVEEFRAGKDKLLGFFVGQAMKQTGGKANPGLLGEMIRKKILG